MKNGLKSGNQNPRTSNGYTLSRSYSQNATTLYSEILLLIKSGKRKWSDEAWQFQLSLSDNYNLEANLDSIIECLHEARNIEQIIVMSHGIPTKAGR